jgi:hypothetical protein
MKRQGETESNPRFQQLNTQLMAIQRAQAIKSQQAQHQQQQQQQLQQQQPQQPLPTPQQQQSLRPVEGQQSPPAMNIPQRPQENGQINGILNP